MHNHPNHQPTTQRQRNLKIYHSPRPGQSIEWRGDLSCWFVCLLACLLFCLFVCWLVGWLVGLAWYGLSLACIVGWLVAVNCHCSQLPGILVSWLACSLVVWVVGCLVVCLVVCFLCGWLGNTCKRDKVEENNFDTDRFGFFSYQIQLMCANIILSLWVRAQHGHVRARYKFR